MVEEIQETGQVPQMDHRKHHNPHGLKIGSLKIDLQNVHNLGRLFSIPALDSIDRQHQRLPIAAGVRQ